MAQRIVKIILPENHGKQVKQLLENQSGLTFWQEESAGGNFIISVLTDTGSSERIMDLFEKSFSSIEGFKLVLLRVEASLPRKEEQKESAPPGPPPAKPRTLSRVSRAELYSDVVDSTQLSPVFIALIVLSTIVAAIGLLKNNVAVIIGAMVIAPLLGPNVALSLSNNLADSKLGLDALKTLAAGIGLAFLLSAGLGFVLKPDHIIPEIMARTHVDFADIILALASGCAGVLAFTMGLSEALIGVMVAVALLPPLTACGLLVGASHFPQAVSALLLFLTNIICVNIAGIITFLIQGISPRTWWETGKAQKRTRVSLIMWFLTLIGLMALIYFSQIKRL